VKKVLLTVFMFLAVALLSVWFVYNHYINIGDRVVTIIIKQGDSFQSVVRRLSDGGVVPSSIVFKGAARLQGTDRRLIPGRYDFSGENSCSSILSRLEAGDFLRIRVTIYEGMPIWKVASVISHKMEIDSAQVIELSEDSSFLAALEIPYLEGYLYPETYLFPWGASTRNILTEMANLHHELIDSLWMSEIEIGLSKEEVIILASIVEAEALLENEKPTIASVYLNRLKRRMKLDADPTVIYGLGGLDRPLWKRDLRKDTPYNTYRRRGLPPTPINSPGKSSIVSVLKPESTSYLYFVADGTGGHKFSRTLAEHNRARIKIKNDKKNSP